MILTRLVFRARLWRLDDEDKENYARLAGSGDDVFVQYAANLRGFVCCGESATGLLEIEEDFLESGRTVYVVDKDGDVCLLDLLGLAP